MKIKNVFLAAFAAIGMIGGAYAAGMFQGYPLVGGQSYCNSSVNGVCNQTVPAGPNLTGLEVIPADTHIAGGSSPQTVLIPSPALGAGLSILATPLTGATITLTGPTSKLILNPAGTIAALTVNLPAASTLVDNQTLRIGSSQIVTALTLNSGTGTSIVGGPTTIAAAGGFELVYRVTNATNGTWYRLQ